MAGGVGVVWLKRDLRVSDHAPLAAAHRSGLPLVVLYCYEPSLLAAHDFGRVHLDFINDSLAEVHAALQRLGARRAADGGGGGASDSSGGSAGCAGLVVRHAEAADALAALHAELAPAGGIVRLWSHEETGTPAVTARNAAVAEWAEAAGVQWTELPQTGVTRNLASRDGWAKRWTQLMDAPMAPAPPSLRLAAGVEPGRLMAAEELGVVGDPKPEAMRGGESRARELLDSFLGGRAAGYSKRMSSPVTAWEGCSRLSASLAWGCISLREVHQRTKAAADALRAAKSKAGGGGKAASRSRGAAKRQRGQGRRGGGGGSAAEEVGDAAEEEAELGEEGPGDDEEEQAEGEEESGAAAGSDGASAGAAVGLKDLAAFTARLRWRSHFMQKLEDQPELVSRNMCTAYDGARDEEQPERERFEAWCQGRTGYPLVDAVVRCLLAGGWVNFRMRAMIFSFASYHLWLHWRFTADFMARHFIDYEPGIHYPQAQMQAGTTGINAFRVYSPSKQVADQDPEGVFIKRYVPELASVPPKHLAEPWRMPPTLQKEVGCVIGQHYPAPIVPPEAGRQNCRQLHAIKASLKAKEEAAQVYEKHGSRKRPGRQGGGGKAGGGKAGSRSAGGAGAGRRGAKRVAADS